MACGRRCEDSGSHACSYFIGAFVIFWLGGEDTPQTLSIPCPQNPPNAPTALSDPKLKP